MLLGPARNREVTAIPGLAYLPLEHLGDLRARTAGTGRRLDSRCRCDPTRAGPGLRRRGRTGVCRSCACDRRRGRAQRAAGRPAGFRQDDARPTAARDSASARRRASASRPRSSTRCRGWTSAMRSPACVRSGRLTTRRRSRVWSGGGTPPRAGEASLAHNGVLFLDEMPEFAPSALQCLRQPLEDGTVTLVQSGGAHDIPRSLHPGRRREPVPVRLPRRPRARVPLPACPSRALRQPDRGPAHGQDRSSLSHVPRPDPAGLLEPARERHDLGAAARGRDERAAVRQARERSASARRWPAPSCSPRAACPQKRVRFLERAARAHQSLRTRRSRACSGSPARLQISTREHRVREPHLAEALGYRTGGATP